MKTLFHLLMFFLMINAFVFSELYSQIIVTINQPPPNKLMVEDLWKIQISNLSGKAQNVYLMGIVSETSNGIIFEAQSSPFIVPVGTYYLKINDISPININYSKKNYEDIAIKTGSLPEGEYDYCVKVIESSSNQELASGCLPQLQIVRNVWSPQLISPADGQIVEVEYPVFSVVLMPDVAHPEPRRLPSEETETKIVEVIGNQSPHDALKSNPAWFIYKTQELSFRYPTWARKFENGKRYAWQVTIYGKFKEVLIESEPSTFTFMYNKFKQNYIGEFTNLSDIRLVKPVDGEIVEDEYPEFSIILMPDVPFPEPPPRVPSDEKKEQWIVEVIGNQTPLEAINNNPPWSIISIIENDFSYPKNVKKLEEGKKYAWQVKIFNKDGTLIGSSKVGFFYYRQKKDLKETDENSSLLNKYPDNYFVSRITDKNNPATQLYIKPDQFNFSIYERVNTTENYSPIKLSGNTKFFMQSSNRQGSNSEIPKNFWRWDINTTLSVYDIPIGFNAFVSSEQKDIRQNINMFQLQLSPQQLINRGIEETEGNFIKNFLSLFSNIGIGTCYPRYSPLTINGISVSGADIEFTPGIFYVAFTYGRTQKPIEGSNILPTYERKLISTKLGLGKKYSTHLYLTAAKSWDESASIKFENASVKPQENYLFGAEAKLTLFDKLFNIDGEFIASVLTRDTKAALLESAIIPDWITKLIKPKISTSADYAFNINTSINLSESTRLAGTYKYIGPGFTTHGIPFLKNDLIAYEIKAEQELFERRLTAKFYYKNNYDNLIPWKRFRTTISSYGINLGLRLRNFPYFQINYSPHYQENDSKASAYKYESTAKLISIMTGYNYSIGTFNNSTNIFISYQDNNALTGYYNYVVRNYSFNHTIGFKFPLFLSATVSMTQSDYYQNRNKIYSLDLSGSYMAFEKWNNTVGINYTTTKEMDKKTGFYLNSSIPVGDFFNLELRAEKNIYDDTRFSDTDYNELILQLSISKYW